MYLEELKLSPFYSLLRAAKQHVAARDALHVGLGPFREAIFDQLQYNLIEVGRDKQRLEIALPGYEASAFSLSVEDNVLRLEVAAKEVNEGERIIKGTIPSGKLVWEYLLGENIEVGEATFVNGVLGIGLQKIVPEDKKPRTIEIKV